MIRPELNVWIPHDGSRENPHPGAIMETAPLDVSEKALGGDWSRVTHYRILKYRAEDNR